MKLLGMEIEKMIPMEEEGRMNVRFHIALEDPLSDSPFGMQITVPVPLGAESTYNSLKSAAIEALRETLADISSSSDEDLSAALQKGV